MNFVKNTIKAILPPRILHRLWDLREELRRRQAKAHGGLEEYGLVASQIYPLGNRFDECLRAGIAPRLEGLVIRRETPVASIGSCFADDLAKHMHAIGFNYISAESHAFPSSANWGRVYTIAGFRQIVRYSTSDDVPIVAERSEEGWFDPLRERATGFFATSEFAEEGIRRHRAASRRAFADARVLILTLGQNEAWIDRRSGLVWARRPPSELLDADAERFEVRTFPFEDNIAWLKESLARLRELNPSLDVLLTVSPVGTYATFCDAEVVTQSFAAKCLLRAVAERARHEVPRVWYFPSFEMALAYNPHTLASDNRHVKFATIDRILRLLHQTVVR